MLRWVTSHPRLSTRAAATVATTVPPNCSSEAAEVVPVVENTLSCTTVTTDAKITATCSAGSEPSRQLRRAASCCSTQTTRLPLRLSHTCSLATVSATIVDPRRLASSSSSPSSASGLRAAELKDEEELVRVLGSHPRHVARRVRQMMATSRKRLSHFRNTVTYLMIVLQGKLQKQEITPGDAAIVVEGILQECVDLGQSDMAHLLFRAALRFRKFGVPVSPKCVHSLYSSFKGTALSGDGQESRRSLLGQLALEMKDQEDLKGVTIAAYIYAGQLKDAQELHSTIPRATLTHDDYCTMISAYANTNNFSELENLVGEAAAISRDDFDTAAVYSAAISSVPAPSHLNNINNNNSNSRNSRNQQSEDLGRLQDTLLAECLQNACKPSDAAVAAIMRRRLSSTQSLDEALAVETDLRHQLKTENVGLPATTAFVLRCADFFSSNFESSDEAMAGKVEQLAAIVDTCIENNETDQIDHSYAIALIRGFGALGRTDKMLEALEKFKQHTMLVDFKIYDECLRWLSRTGHVKQLLEVKEQMEKEHIYHSTFTYVSVLRGLGKFYPRLTHKYIDEARKALPFFDERMYGQIIQSYSILGDVDKVKEIYAEMADRDSRGRRPFNAYSVAQLLYGLAPDTKLFDEVVALANRRGLFTTELVQRAVISGYSSQKRVAELSNFVSQLPKKSFQIYLALVQAYGKLDDVNGFDRLLDEMRASRVAFNDTFFSIAADICARWRDSGRFKRMVEISQGAASASRKGYVTAKDPRTIARIAHAHAMMGDHETVGALWKDLRDSGAQIPMSVFNRFLEMTVRRNDLAFAQDVLEVMMTRVPPNPVTTTTVMDMLARMGRLHEVQVLLDEMCRTRNIQPTLVTFHHAMTAFAKVGDVANLVALRERLQQIGLKENNVTFNILLSGFGRAQRFDAIPELLNERANHGIPLDTNCYEILLDIYAKARLTNELENTVQAILNRTASAAVNSDMVVEAAASSSSGASRHHLASHEDEDSPDRANVMGAAANPLTPRLLAAIATAYSHIGDVANVEKFIGMLLAHKKCRQSHIETCFLIYHRLRDMSKLDSLLAKYGGSEFILNICISAFAKAGMHDRVASILEELQAKKYALHTNTAVVLSTLLLKAGKVELAQTVLKFRRVAEAQQLRGGANNSSSSSSSSSSGGRNSQLQQQQGFFRSSSGASSPAVAAAASKPDDEVDVAAVAEQEVFAEKV